MHQGVREKKFIFFLDFKKVDLFNQTDGKRNLGSDKVAN